jgi:hypothetical protein
MLWSLAPMSSSPWFASHEEPRLVAEVWQAVKAAAKTINGIRDAAGKRPIEFDTD